jgi:hypothetical protein
MNPILHRHSYLLVLSLIFVLSLPTIDMRGNMNQEIDWMVKEGDSQTFVYKKYFSIYRDNPYQANVIIQTDKGNYSTIEYKAGITIAYEIEIVTEYELRGKKTFNGNITSSSHTIAYGSEDWVIRKSINNASYWFNLYNEKDHYSVVDNLIIYDYTISSDYLNYEVTEEWNWKSGWLNYYHEKQWNKTGTLFEFEFSVLSNQVVSYSSVNIFFGSTLLILILGALLIIRKHSVMK